MIFRRKSKHSIDNLQTPYPVIHVTVKPPIYGIRELPVPTIVFGTRRSKTDLEVEVIKNEKNETFLVVSSGESGEILRSEIGICENIIEAGEEMKNLEIRLNRETKYTHPFQIGVCEPTTTCDYRIHEFLANLCYISQYDED